MQFTKQAPRAGRAVLLAALSFLGGAVNGLFGTGGGTVLVLSLSALLSRGREKDAFIISSVGVLCFSAVSAAVYGAGGNLDLSGLPRFALPAVVGGVAGAFLFRRIGTVLLRRIFALLTLYAGLRMLGVFG